MNEHRENQFSFLTDILLLLTFQFQNAYLIPDFPVRVITRLLPSLPLSGTAIAMPR